MTAQAIQGGERELARRHVVLALVALMTLALVARLWTLDFALPFAQEPDPHIIGQIELLSKDELTDEDVFYSSIYPHLLARTAMLFGDVTREPEGVESFTLDQHLAAAGRLHVRVRTVIAFFSVLIVPATFWIACYFVGRKWALFAAALAATSTLSLQFGQMARPHAAVGPLIALAIGAALHLRHRGDTRSFVIAGALASLALACLINACVALVPAAVAYLLRNNARRRIFDARLLIPIALLSLTVWIAYPFFFIERPPGAEAPVEEGTFNFAWQSINWNDFAGQGMPTLFMTLWYYEPVALVLAMWGLVAWLGPQHLVPGANVHARGIVAWSMRKDTPEIQQRRRDLIVVLSFALLYALIIGLYRRNQQRFLLPLLPFVAVLAAYGMRAITRSRPKLLTIALLALALALPTLACIGYTRMRTRPHTLEQLASWIEGNLERESERFGLHSPFDVPLAREHGQLFDEGGLPKPALSPWLVYQQRWMDRVWRGERWKVEDLYGRRTGWPAIVTDPDAHVAALGLDFAAVPGGEGVGASSPLVAAVRGALARAGTRVEELPHETRPPPSGLEGLDTPHFTAFVLSARWFGPQLDVFHLDRTQR